MSKSETAPQHPTAKLAGEPSDEGLRQGDVAALSDAIGRQMFYDLDQRGMVTAAWAGMSWADVPQHVRDAFMNACPLSAPSETNAICSEEGDCHLHVHDGRPRCQGTCKRHEDKHSEALSAAKRIIAMSNAERHVSQEESAMAMYILSAPSAKKPTVEFTAWLDTYKPGVVFDQGDMAACWYASQRATTAEIVDAALKESVLKTRHLRRDEEAGQDRGIKGLCDQPITGASTDGKDHG